MISIIIYGRNDDHGYHYKKRSAISINAMAEVLDDADDEILFVDYNTPNDLPTLPEAIQDNLTTKAKQKLRVFRIRPEFHQQFAATTHLKIIEPTARNIALRRSNPNNRWILSTNSDMIFVPHNANQTLSSIIKNLADGFYQLPRYEIPEILWESLFTHPLEAQQNLNTLRDSADQFHLKTAATFNNIYRYDNPGDFQLMLRDDVFKIDGFDQRMVLGWTVDSNICKRLYLLRGDVKNIEDQLDTYHCNHTRKESLLHNHKSRYNCPKQFAENVTDPYLPQQRDYWGYPEIEFEEIRLLDGQFVKFKKALLATLSDQYNAKLNITLDVEDDTQYNREYIFPYIADHLASLHTHTDIAYVGFNQHFADMLQRFWQHMGYKGKIHLPNLTSSKQPLDKCQIIIIDMLPTVNQIYDQEAQHLKKYLKQLNNLNKHTKLIGINIDKCNRILKFKKLAHVVARSTVSNTIYGYVK